MTNFEINMTNQVQKTNKVNFENKLNELGVSFETDSFEGYIFISVFHILDEEFVITPKGRLGTTNDETFDSVDEMIEYIQTNY